MVTLSLATINSYIHQSIASEVIYAFTVGFGSTVLIFILGSLANKPRRDRQPLHFYNLAAVFFQILRSILDCIIGNASYRDIGPMFLHTWAQFPPRAFAPIVISAAINPIIYALIAISLILQVRIGFAAEPTTRRIVTWIGTLAAVVLVAFATTLAGFAIVVQFRSSVITPPWLYTTTRIYFVVFVGISCVAFLFKLGQTMYRRRGLGQTMPRRRGMSMKGFGGLHIIFIVTTECLVIPCNLPAPLMSVRS